MTRPAVGLRQRHYDRISKIMQVTGRTRVDIVTAALDRYIEEAVIEKVLREVEDAQTYHEG